jgi:hypothetical protein
MAVVAAAHGYKNAAKSAGKQLSSYIDEEQINPVQVLYTIYIVLPLRQGAALRARASTNPRNDGTILVVWRSRSKPKEDVECSNKIVKRMVRTNSA